MYRPPLNESATWDSDTDSTSSLSSSYFDDESEGPECSEGPISSKPRSPGPDRYWPKIVDRGQLRSSSEELLANGLLEWESAKFDSSSNANSPHVTSMQKKVKSKGIFKKKRFESISLESTENYKERKKPPREVTSASHPCASSKKKKKESSLPPALPGTERHPPPTKSSQPARNQLGRHSSLAAIRVQLPLPTNDQAASHHKNKKNRTKGNPYQGSTPRTPVDIVQPNENGVYNFTPSAAAFKWDWNLLDVRKRPIGGMTPQPTPAHAFKTFRSGFAVSPIAKKSNTGHNFLQPLSKRRNYETKLKPDGLPEFPIDRKVAKAVRKRNLAFSPGGQAQGKQVEMAYQPIYDKLVSAGGEEPSNFKLQGRKILPNNKNGMHVRSRGVFGRSSSSQSMTEVESQQFHGIYHSEHSPLLKKNDKKGGVVLGTALDQAHLISHAIHATLWLGTAFLMDYNHQTETHLHGRRLSESTTASTVVRLSILVFGAALLYEIIRAVFLFARFKKPRPDDTGSAKGNLWSSLKLSLMSSSLALSLLSLVSMGISAFACVAFTVFNKSGPTFLQSESRSFLWTVGLVHTGVSSGLLTRRLLAKLVPKTEAALAVLEKRRIAVILGCVFPATFGWMGTRILAQWICPSFHKSDLVHGGRSGFDLISGALSAIMSLLEFFEASGYWSTILWWLVAATGSLIMLDFVDLTISLTSEYYHHGIVVIDKNREPSASKFTTSLLVSLLAQATIGTGLGTGSFWQWPLNVASVCYNRYNRKNKE